MSRLLLALFCCAALSCVTDKPLEDAPIAPLSSDKSSAPPPALKPLAPPPALKPLAPSESALKTPVSPPDNDCQTLPSGIKLPYHVSGSSVIVIGFLKTCQTVDGEEGFQRGSSWTALGFPCTAGRGRIDKKGGENIPSVVTFHLQNSCPMQPGRPEDVERLVRQKLAIPADSRLIAYYPLAVDYWEFMDYPEQDIGFRPELYRPTSISQGWQKFSSKSEALKIRLFGRENAWEPGKKLYEVEARLLPEGRSTFRVEVLAARSLDEAGKNAVRERCDALRPKRDCPQIFGP